MMSCTLVDRTNQSTDPDRIIWQTFEREALGRHYRVSRNSLVENQLERSESAWNSLLLFGSSIFFLNGRLKSQRSRKGIFQPLTGVLRSER